MQSTRTIHLLKSVFRDENLGVSHRKKTYVVGYLTSSEALYATRNITSNVNVSLGKYRPNMKSNHIKHKENEIVITMNHPVMVTVTKEYSPQFEWIIHDVPVQQFMNIPIMYNVGLIIPFEKLNETPETITYSSYVVDPVKDVNMFRFGLRLND